MSDQPSWTSGPMHSALVTFLPFYTLDAFGESPRLDVPKLHKALNCSNETVYKWLRQNRLTPSNVKRIVALALDKENRDALTRLGRDEPTIQDFTRFVFV